MSDAPKYRAFLSYSHRDQQLGEWLHRALEHYSVDKELVGRPTSVGPVPKSLRPIFRDRDDFSAGHSLTEQTRAALRASDFLIVVCSPSAARSKYVNEEIHFFKAIERSDRIIPVIIDGEPGSLENECFPPALRYRVSIDGTITDDPEEPIAADLRSEADGRNIGKLKIVAGLLGLALDEIVRRDEQARRQRLRVWIGILAAVTVGFAALASWAEINRREAMTQRSLAEQRRQEAERNFSVAKQSIDALVFDIASSLREVPGMRIEALRRILEGAEKAVNRLVDGGSKNLDLMRTQAAMLLQFGDTYGAQGDLAKQRSSITSSLEIYSFLGNLNKTDNSLQHDIALAHLKLGEMSVVRGDFVGALGSFRNSLAIFEKLARINIADEAAQNDLAAVNDRVADVLVAQGKRDEALELFKNNLDTFARLSQQQPDTPLLQRNLANGYQRIGDFEFTRKRFSDADANYQKALSIRQTLVSRDPLNTALKVELSLCWERIGRSALSSGNGSEALQALQTSLGIRRELLRLDPSNLNLSRNYVLALRDVSNTLLVLGRPSEALALLREAYSIAEPALSQNSENIDWLRTIASVAMSLGEAFEAIKQLDDALKAYGDGYRFAKKAATAAPDNQMAQSDLYTICVILAGARVQQRQPRAMPLYHEALSIAELQAAKNPVDEKWKRRLLELNSLLASYGDDAVRRLTFVIDALQQKNAEKELTAEDKSWLVDMQNKLAAANR